MIRAILDIEKLVEWALREQGLGWGAPGERGREVAGLEELGTLIDETDHGWHPSAALFTDDDALVVRQEIDRLPPATRALLVVHGRTGTRPEGADEVLGAPEQMRNRRGQLMWIHEQPGNRRSPRRPMLDWLGHSARREAIGFARNQWTAWREGLVALVPMVNDRMETHRALLPSAPAWPWLVAAPVVHGLDAGVAAARQELAAGAAERGRMEAMERLATLDDRRAEARAPVTSDAPVLWGEGRSGVALSTVAEGVADAGRAALRARYGKGGDSR